MTPADAANLLGIDATTPPEQLEARYQELRAKLEDRIAKAPTPGLKEKYRASLAEVTSAFETLTLAADASALPVLQRPASAPGPAAAPAAAPAPAARASTPVRDYAAPPARRRKGSWEFAIVVVVALAVLAGGGWWVLQLREQKAEQARQEAAAAAAARAEADRLAVEAEKEKARQEARFAQLRAGLAEARVRWESVERELQPAERRLAELRSDLRSTRDLPAPLVAELQAQFEAQNEWVGWLQSHLARNPVKTQLAKLEAFVAATALDDAAAVLPSLTADLDEVEAQIRSQAEVLLALVGPVEIHSEPTGLAYTFTDAYGRTREGVTPFQGELPLGPLTVRIQRGDGWTSHEETLRVKRRETVTVAPVFEEGLLQLRSAPAGLPFEVTNAAGYRQTGTTPADLAAVPAGELRVRMRREGWAEAERRLTLAGGDQQTVSEEFAPGRLTVTSVPAGAEVWRDEQKLGVTPLTLEFVPGEVELAVQARGHQSASLRQVVAQKDALTAEVILQPWPKPTGGTGFENSLGMRFAPVAGTGVLFAIWETRRGDYALFAKATNRPPSGGVFSYDSQGAFAPHGLHNWTNPGFEQDDRHPVVGVNWHDAQAFCAWLTERERAEGRLTADQRYRLPTDAEWSVAVGLAENARQSPMEKTGRVAGYPWGHAYPPPAGAGNYIDEATRRISTGWTIIAGYNDGFAYTAPVGSFTANPFGLYDLGGNVWEWCEDTYSPTDSRYVLRGSGWNVTLPYLASAVRAVEPPTAAGIGIGFRCVLDLAEKPATGGTATLHLLRPAGAKSALGGAFYGTGESLAILNDGARLRTYQLPYGVGATVNVRAGSVHAATTAGTKSAQAVLEIAPGEERFYMLSAGTAELVLLTEAEGRAALAALRLVEPANTQGLAEAATGAPEQTDSIVHFYRPSRFTAGARKLYLTVDGRRYTLGNNDRLTVRAPAGALQFRMEIAGEDVVVSVPVLSGEPTYVECDVSKFPSIGVVRPAAEGSVAVARLKHVEGSLQL